MQRLMQFMRYILRTSLEYQVINSLLFEKSRGIQPAADRLNCSFSNMQRYLISIKKEVIKWDITVTSTVTNGWR